MRATTILLTTVLFIHAVQAQLPGESLTVSGVLKDAAGAPVTGTADLTFYLHDSAAGGLLLWSEAHVGVPLDQLGRYQVTLGGTSPLSPVQFQDPDVWFTVEVNGDGPMAPRLPLSRVPTAFNSDLLDGSPASTFAAAAQLFDQDPMTTPVDWLDLLGMPPGFADLIDDVDDADADPINELNTTLALNAATLELTDAGGLLTADLSSLIDDGDADPANELNTTLALNAAILELTDAGGLLSADLSSLIDDADADPTNELQDWMTLPGIPAGFADGIDDVNDADADPANELNATLALNAAILELTDAGGLLSADLSSLIDDADADPTNELQDWATLPGIPPGFADGVDDVNDADADPANELNATLALNAAILELTDAGGLLSADLSSLIDDADADPTNELQDWATLPGIPPGFADGVDDVNDADADPTNELQDWATLPGIPPGFADGVDDVNDADADPTNELQDWATLPGIPPGFADGVDDVIDADADPTNELQDWATLPGIPPEFADGVDDVIDADNDPTNELQDWTTLLGIPPGFADGVDDVDDADNDPTNELNFSMMLIGAGLELTDSGGTLMADLSSLVGGPPSGLAGGDLAGTYPNPNIAMGAVTSAALLDGGVSLVDLDLPGIDGRYVNVAGDIMTGALTVPWMLSDSFISLGQSSPSDNDFLFFDQTQAFLVWEDAQDRFELSDDLAVQGALLVANSVTSMTAQPTYNSLGTGTPDVGLINDSNDLYVTAEVEIDGWAIIDDRCYADTSLNVGFDAVGPFDNALNFYCAACPGFAPAIRWVESWQELRFEGDGKFLTNLVVNGTLSKGAGAFHIDHPLDPENKYLDHSFVESPDMMNVYNGNVVLDDCGQASVELPEWFQTLNRDFRYQLTAIGAPGPDLYISREIEGNQFEISGGAPGCKISWQVTGIRQDPYAEQNRIQVEVDKPEGERGKYLHPEAYGQPAERGIAPPLDHKAPFEAREHP